LNYTRGGAVTIATARRLTRRRALLASLAALSQRLQSGTGRPVIFWSASTTSHITLELQ